MPYTLLKALLDFVLAVLLLIPLTPVLLLISLAIRLDSPGEALYRQTRVGRLGVPFVIFKFRTMKTGTPVLSTEEMQRQAFDPYTRLGRFLRKTSLDELPQLFNILRGEMSFIGPRPALPSQEDLNTLRAELGADRVRPGITGLAQVMGRDDLDTSTKADYDARYSRERSLLLDLKILLRTFGAIFTGRGNK